MTDMNVMVGIQGSGKSTQAKLELKSYDPGEAVIVSRDGLRDMLFGTRIGLTPEQERLITVGEQALTDKYLGKGISVVSDNMNLRMDYRKVWAALAAKHGATYRQLDLTHIDLETCLERNQNRDNPVPSQVVVDAYNRYIKGKPSPKEFPAVVDTLSPGYEPYVPDTSKPRVILVDIDGTVADHQGVRSPYDTTKYHLDKPKQAVIDLVQEHVYQLRYKVVFCSGRHRDFFDVTYDWLMQHVKVPVEKLVMREHPNTRDDIEKLSLFNCYIRDEYNVVRVFDDRDRVVEMWRGIGLPVFQVARGDF